MAKVDSKGRIIVPKAVRERLGIAPGSEVEIYEEELAKVVLKPHRSPEEIIERLEQLVDEFASERRETTPLNSGTGPITLKFRDAIQRGAEKADNE